MWFWLSLVTLLFWSGSDLFGKLGSGNTKDRTSHLKMICSVGLIMGIHALFSLFLGSAELSWDVFIKYLPVSLLYIVSMAFSYMAFRYIELSISSPICNSSGALVAILVLVTQGLGEDLSPWSLVAVIFVCTGVILLGFVEAHEDEELRAARQDASNHRYAKSKLAFVLPILYCILDALGTFADSRVLEVLDEDSANCAYELTFFAAAVVCFVYLKVKGARGSDKGAGARAGSEKLSSAESKKLWSFRILAGVCETVGQLSYVYALADTEHVAFAAPIMASFCIGSVILSRIFLKERLSVKHYIAIGIVFVGIVILGILD